MKHMSGHRNKKMCKQRKTKSTHPWKRATKLRKSEKVPGLAPQGEWEGG